MLGLYLLQQNLNVFWVPKEKNSVDAGKDVFSYKFYKILNYFSFEGDSWLGVGLLVAAMEGGWILR